MYLAIYYHPAPPLPPPGPRQWLNETQEEHPRRNIDELLRRGVVVHYTPHYIFVPGLVKSIVESTELFLSGGGVLRGGGDQTRFLVLLREPTKRTVSSWFYHRGKHPNHFLRQIQRAVSCARAFVRCLAPNVPAEMVKAYVDSLAEPKRPAYIARSQTEDSAHRMFPVFYAARSWNGNDMEMHKLLTGSGSCSTMDLSEDSAHGEWLRVAARGCAWLCEELIVAWPIRSLYSSPHTLRSLASLSLLLARSPHT